MRLSRRAGGTAAAAAFCLLLSACGGDYNNGSSGGGSSKAGGEDGPLKVNMAVAPGTLDPASGCGANDLAMIGSLYTRLTQYGSKAGPDGTTEVDPGKIEPYAAESWTTSEDGKTYTFKLRAGAKFPSGKPVDAEAVKYSFERTLTMNGCGGYFLHDGLLDPPLIKKIEAQDPTTVDVRPQPGRSRTRCRRGRSRRPRSSMPRSSTPTAASRRTASTSTWPATRQARARTCSSPTSRTRARS